MNRPIIAGNWKMNMTIEEGRQLASRMKPGLEEVDDVNTVLCPPFTALPAVGEVLRGSSVALGAQDMYHEMSGAYTGEVSPAMLAELCRFVIIGHSERRQLFGETDDSVSKKVEAALEVGLRPIVCVGERLEERDGGLAESVVQDQIGLGLERVATTEDLVLAYEPVWAIGTGKAATSQDAQVMMAHIRGLLAVRFGDEAAGGVALLYGGSVTAENVAEFVGQPDIDGALVGGASLKADSFVELVRNVADAVR